MSTPENTFIASVHRHLPPELYRMKNHNQYNSGIPDVWYSGYKADLWIEYKFIVLPKRADTMIVPNLSNLQHEWLLQRHMEGRRVGVIVGCKEGGVWIKNTDWGRPCSCEDFHQKILTRAVIADLIKDEVGRCF
jgi:hypothetical protein